MLKLVLLRHGESLWNRENRFTGWTDVELSAKGTEEAKEAGRRLKAAGFIFDLAFTSVLKRAEDTLMLTLNEMGLKKVETLRSWRLNERHYGALQGLNKAETAVKYGEKQVAVWRRSYDVPPPLLTREDKRFPGNDPLYRDVPVDQLPLGESLKDTIERFLPYWEETIKPPLRQGRHIIIAAHGNTLRALVKHLDRIPDAEIAGLEIPTGVPLVYELDESLGAIKSYYLAK